jgi:hypothetical protein
MLTAAKRTALDGLLAEAEHRYDERSIPFVGCAFYDLDEVCTIIERKGFHVVDCELFRHRRISTDEFCERIGWSKHVAFALLLPRVVPHSIAMLLYQAADHGIITTSSSYESGERYRSLSEKSWVIVMTPEDLENAELETGWDRSRLTRVLAPYCWLHDDRWD